MKIYEISLRLLTTYLVTDFDTIVSQFKSTDYKTNQYWLCFAVYMWWVQGRVHYGAWSPGVWWADDYWWVPFPPCTGAWRPVAGMCKLDQVSPLRPGEASYHNQGWDMRPPVNNTIHHTWGWHLLIFTSISLPLSFNIGALEDVTYLNIKNISFQHAKFPPDDGLTTDQGEEMSALCSKFKIPVSSSPFRGQGRHLRGWVHPCYRFYGYGILFTICKF